MFDFDIMSTHPSTPDRVARAVASARELGAPGLGIRDRAEYLAAINGVAFGDDPNEGFVRDRKFTHPRLNFSFYAPEDFYWKMLMKQCLALGSQTMKRCG